MKVSCLAGSAVRWAWVACLTGAAMSEAARPTCQALFATQAADPVAEVFLDYPSILNYAPVKPITRMRLQRMARQRPGTGWMTGFVPLRSSREVYTEYRPAKNGKPTVVFLNGLTHSVKDWDRVVDALRDPDMGLILYDPQGQGMTLQEAQIWPLASIPLHDQAEDLESLLVRLRISGAVHLMGLSYGGGLAVYYGAQFPSRVASVVALAPFTERLPDQDRLVRDMMTAFRLMYPFAPISDSDLYDMFLRNLVYGLYPQAEPAILDFLQKPEGAWQMVREMKDFRASEHVGALPAGSFHLVVAGSDQYITRDLSDRFWSSVPQAVRGSRVDLVGVEHKINEAQPEWTARFLERVVSRGSLGGGEFQGRRGTLIIRSDRYEMDLAHP